ncbi:Zinc/iron permease [Rhodotorula sp. JG-1b]|nr:Zinc/iron permease [Rhodotorula sp. JG-1b]
MVRLAKSSTAVLLIGSFIGVLLPIICSTIVSGRVFRAIFFATKHFGTGVISCTAFVHLLYHGFVMFSNACLGELAFEPAAAAISLAGVYIVFSVDFFVMRWLHSRGERRLAASNAANGDDAAESIASSSHIEKELIHAQRDLGHCHGPAREIATDYSSAQAHFDVLILEAGIIFHSVMIGVSLGASGGDQWIPVFIAIVFHQLFEGLALGSRIAQLVWPAGKEWKKWALTLPIGLVTPVGIAIGIGLHATYNPNSGASLLSIGVLDSFSAGILIYTGIIECLYHDFMHGSLARAGLGRVSAALFFVLAGSLCMAVIGKWA